MNEAVQQCIDKLKTTKTHVSSEEIVENTGSDIAATSDPQINVLEPAEVWNILAEKFTFSGLHSLD